MTIVRRWRFWEYLPLLASVLGREFQLLFSRKLSPALKKKEWQGKEEDEITAGELLWLSFHRAQWLKVNLEFCTLSDCPGVFSHQTSSCVASRLELKLLLNLLLSVWNFSFRLSSGSKAFARNFSCSHHINPDLIFTYWSEFNTHCNADFYWAGSSVKIFLQAPLEVALWSIIKHGFNPHFENGIRLSYLHICLVSLRSQHCVTPAIQVFIRVLLAKRSVTKSWAKIIDQHVIVCCGRHPTVIAEQSWITAEIGGHVCQRDR